ncbi:hypothetical protein ACHAQH_000537 [Verticillium albo-atrum]
MSETSEENVFGQSSHYFESPSTSNSLANAQPASRESLVIHKGRYFLKGRTLSGNHFFKILEEIFMAELIDPLKANPVDFEKTTLGALNFVINGKTNVLMAATSSNQLVPGRNISEGKLLDGIIWNERVKTMAILLKMNIGAPYDAHGRKDAGPDCYGD